MLKRSTTEELTEVTTESTTKPVEIPSVTMPEKPTEAPVVVTEAPAN